MRMTLIAPAAALCVGAIVLVVGVSWLSDDADRAAALEPALTTVTPINPVAPAEPPEGSAEETRIVALDVDPGIGTDVARGDAVSVHVTYVDGRLPADLLNILVFVLSAGCGQAAEYPPIELLHDGVEKSVVLTASWEPYKNGEPAASGAIADVVALPVGPTSASLNRSIGDCPGNGSAP